MLAPELSPGIMSQMPVPNPSWVDLDGEVMPGSQARISVFSHGFLFGDSVYEVLRTYGGRASLVDAHLDRLERSARKLALSIPIDREALLLRVDRLLAQAGFDESYLRIVVSRGVGQPNIDPRLAGETQLMLMAIPLVTPAPALYQTGVDAVLVAVRRTSPQSNDPDIKSGNYLNCIQAVMEATQRGAAEGILLNDRGHLTEASTSNVFLVSEGTLITPAVASGILQGITRSELLKLAVRDGIPVHEREVAPEELLGADEAFLSSTLKEVMPISRIDGQPLASCPGPISRRLLSLYRETFAGGD